MVMRERLAMVRVSKLKWYLTHGKSDDYYPACCKMAIMLIEKITVVIKVYNVLNISSDYSHRANTSFPFIRPGLSNQGTAYYSINPASKEHTFTICFYPQIFNILGLESCCRKYAWKSVKLGPSCLSWFHNASTAGTSSWARISCADWRNDAFKLWLSGARRLSLAFLPKYIHYIFTFNKPLV